MNFFQLRSVFLYFFYLSRWFNLKNYDEKRKKIRKTQKRQRHKDKKVIYTPKITDQKKKKRRDILPKVDLPIKWPTGGKCNRSWIEANLQTCAPQNTCGGAAFPQHSNLGDKIKLSESITGKIVASNSKPMDDKESATARTQKAWIRKRENINPHGLELHFCISPPKASWTILSEPKT